MEAYNTYLPSWTVKPVVSTTKGEEILDGLMLSQYENKPNFKEFMMAFFAEMDTLFEQAEEVYLGRFLAFAIGAQLDIIGEIIGQPRDVGLPTFWHGYTDAGVEAPGLNLAPLADEAAPAEGGLFVDENFAGYNVVPLDDATYRRLLVAKAYCNNLRATINSEDVYYIASVLLNKVPSFMRLQSKSSNPALAERQLELEIPILEVGLDDAALILYTARFFVPTGTSFSVQRI